MSLEILRPPTIASFAKDAIGLLAANATRSEAELRATIVAETVRVGLCRLLHESPLRRVHQNQLRNWVRRKLEGVIPDLFTDERGNYRDLLLDGRGGNLGFTGDVLTLPDGYLYPAPTRAIPIADNTYVLASGFPSTAFQDLRDRLVFTALARRIEGVTKPELQALGIRIQSIESYLASSGANESRDGILADVLKRPRQPWVGTASWQCYRGNNPSAYGFPFTEESRTARYGQHDVSLWWEPITLSYGHYWLRATRSRREDHAHQVSPREWKRVALALDVVSGGQREAIGTKGPLGVTLRLNFSPAENVYRWFQVSGVRWLGRRKAQDEWEIPLPALEPIRKLLDQAGVRIRVLGEGR